MISTLHSSKIFSHEFKLYRYDGLIELISLSLNYLVNIFLLSELSADLTLKASYSR